MNLSIVIPAYNECESVANTVREVMAAAGRVSDIKKLEVIVIDDHSSDSTYDAVVALGDTRIRCLRLSRRSGSHVAIRAGLGEASGEAILCISADGQNDPSCIGEMLEKWRKGSRIVWAIRRNRSNEPWHVKSPARLFYRLLTMLGGSGRTDVDVSRISFFLIDRSVAEAVNSCSERNTSVFGLLLWLGFEQDHVEYDHRPRRFGRSKWDLAKRLRLVSDWIIGFSGLPLTLIFAVGLIVTVLGILYAIYALFAVIAGAPAHGWIFVLTAVLFLGGIQMMMVGVIGEYLWRNLDESRKRPLFFVDKRSG